VGGGGERKDVECDLRRQQRIDEVRSDVLNARRRVVTPLLLACILGLTRLAIALKTRTFGGGG